MTYFKQIDGLRAIAVTMVLLYHWLPSFEFLRTFHIGPLGVSVFFVLSGFLISRILLESKIKLDNSKDTLGSILKIFYIRRGLRIFPVYYLLLFLLFALNFETVREEILYHSLYISNVLYVINGEYSNGMAHLWSLSVEEQFYLIWPFCILLIPFKKIKWFLISMIVFGVFNQLFLSNTLVNGSLLMPARIDAFAWGGLLAYLYVTDKNWYLLVTKLRLLIGFVSILFITLHFMDLGALSPIKNNIFHFICFYIIAVTVKGIKGPIGFVLESSVFVFLGKISYGIYLYHNLMQWLVPYFADLIGVPFPNQSQEFLRFIIYLIITILVSALSWYIVEKPINKLKNKAKYSSTD